MRGSTTPCSTRRATVGALVLCLLVTLACISAAPLRLFAPRRPFAHAATRSIEPPTVNALSLLRGGSSEEGEEKQQENAEATNGPDTATVGKDELSVEDEQDEEIAPESLDGDAVSVSADAFIHPSHEEPAEDILTTSDVVDENAFYPAAEGEDEGSTTPVMPVDDDDGDNDDDILAEAEEHAAAEEDDDDVEEVEYVGAEETDETKLQSGSTFTDDESAAYVDRMDFADDEGETPVVEVETEAVVPIPAGTDDDNDVSCPAESATPNITDAIADIEEDDIDPLDLNEVRSTCEALERERQATVAAATETARGTSASPLGAATVQYMITRNMKNVLTDELGYTEVEVNNMKPDVAAVLTSKRLKRPSTGMPDAFYVDGKAPSPKKNQLREIMKSKIVQRIILPAVGIGLSALLTANAIQHSRIGSAAISVKQNVVSAPIAPVPEEQVTELSNDEKRRKTTANLLESPPAVTGIVGDDPLNESAALRTGTQALPNLNDSWIDRTTSRLLEVFRFRR